MIEPDPFFLRIFWASILPARETDAMPRYRQNPLKPAALAKLDAHFQDRARMADSDPEQF